MDKASANTAGYMYHSPAWSLPQIEKAAPIIGPKRNPRLKATPIRAIPFPLVAGVDTSVMMAVDRLTLPAQYLVATGQYKQPTFGYSANNSGKHKYCEVTGHDPQQIGDRNAFIKQIL